MLLGRRKGNMAVNVTGTSPEGLWAGLPDVALRCVQQHLPNGEALGSVCSAWHKALAPTQPPGQKWRQVLTWADGVPLEHPIAQRVREIRDLNLSEERTWEVFARHFGCPLNANPGAFLRQVEERARRALACAFSRSVPWILEVRRQAITTPVPDRSANIEIIISWFQENGQVLMNVRLPLFRIPDLHACLYVPPGMQSLVWEIRRRSETQFVPGFAIPQEGRVMDIMMEGQSGSPIDFTEMFFAPSEIPQSSRNIRRASRDGATVPVGWAGVSRYWLYGRIAVYSVVGLFAIAGMILYMFHLCTGVGLIKKIVCSSIGTFLGLAVGRALVKPESEISCRNSWIYTLRFLVFTGIGMRIVYVDAISTKFFVLDRTVCMWILGSVISFCVGSIRRDLETLRGR